MPAIPSDIAALESNRRAILQRIHDRVTILEQELEHKATTTPVRELLAQSSTDAITAYVEFHARFLVVAMATVIPPEDRPVPPGQLKQIAGIRDALRLIEEVLVAGDYSITIHGRRRN